MKEVMGNQRIQYSNSVILYFLTTKASLVLCRSDLIPSNPTLTSLDTPSSPSRFFPHVFPNSRMDPGYFFHESNLCLLFRHFQDYFEQSIISKFLTCHYPGSLPPPLLSLYKTYNLYMNWLVACAAMTLALIIGNKNEIKKRYGSVYDLIQHTCTIHMYNCLCSTQNPSRTA